MSFFGKKTKDEPTIVTGIVGTGGKIDGKSKKKKKFEIVQKIKKNKNRNDSCFS